MATALSPEELAALPPELQAQYNEAVEKTRGVPGGDFVLGQAAEKLREKNKLTSVDPTRFVYGGSEEARNEAVARFRAQAEGAQNRPGEKIDYGNAASMADLMRARAEGRTPSIAGMMADRQMKQAAAEQSSAAASARGPAALALAQQGAAANTATMQSNISGQAQVNAAQERERAEGNAYNAYSSMAEKQAALNAAQRAQNDSFTMGMTGNEIGVNSAQLGAGQNFANMTQSGAMGYAHLEAARRAGQPQGNPMGAMAGIAGAVGGSMLGGPAGGMVGAQVGGAVGNSLSDERAKVPAAIEPKAKTEGPKTLTQRLTEERQPREIREARSTAPPAWLRSEMEGKQTKALERPVPAAVQKAPGMNLRDALAAAPQYVPQAAAPAPVARAAPSFDLYRPPALIPVGQPNYSDEKTKTPAGGVSDGAVADANRALASEAYAYKPGFGPDIQAPGEVNFGPMAQRMARSPVARTAVKEDPDSGMLVLDRDKLAKVTAGGVASLQEQVDDLRSLMARRMGGRR